MEEQTLVLIKPDGLNKSLTGNVLSRLSETKLDIVAARIVQVSKKLAEEHYALLKDKPFFPELIKYLMGDFHKKKVMALVYWGDDAIAKVRKICGATNPEEAEREIKLWFSPDEMITDLYPVKTVKETSERRVWA